MKVEWCIDCNNPATECVCDGQPGPTATVTHTKNNRIFKTVTVAKVLDTAALSKDELDFEVYKLTKLAKDTLTDQDFAVDGAITRWIEEREIDLLPLFKVMVSGWKDE